uniref:Uncharacterized protein n=1 Tax=Physcomitrium patens TaxID=3218 RepID=A0A2K1JMT9_PHYPA|nr:hypothetical protein PHYPA_017536 [Physcomitrium patens]
MQTNANTQWDDDNLPKWIRDLGKNRVFITSLPPVDEDEETEKEYKIIRDESLARLEIELERSFAERGYKYSNPTINKMNESELRQMARRILANFSIEFCDDLLCFKALGIGMQTNAGCSSMISV